MPRILPSTEPTGTPPASPFGAAPDESLVHFDAILRPHRSLSPAGFTLLMSAVASVGFGAGIAFLMMGAWPVFGFCGLEVVLIYVCFRLNYRSGRIFERVRLTDRALTVERHNVRGAPLGWTFQPYWLRVVIDDPPEHDSPLTLRSHGRSLVIGSFLTPEERLDFAQALRSALARQRTAPPA